MKTKKCIVSGLIGAALFGAPTPLLAELVRIVPETEIETFWLPSFPDAQGILIENIGSDSTRVDDVLLDINEDGINDFRIGAYGGNSGFQLRCLSQNTVWVDGRASNSGDINRHVIPLQVDDVVGEMVSREADYGGSWQNTEYGTLSGYIGSGFEGIPLLASGHFANGVTGYAGLRFEAGTNTHYGYVLIEEVEWLNGGGFILEYGYESEPDTAFTIIPEPGSVVMWLGGAGLLTLYRRERARCRKHPDDVR